MWCATRGTRSHTRLEPSIGARGRKHIVKQASGSVDEITSEICQDFRRNAGVGDQS